jgi:signal transduction histidine kinase
MLIKKRLQNEWSGKGREVSVINAVPIGLEANMVYSDTQLAIVNIMLNAVEHGIEKKGTIEIRGYRDEAFVFIEIENDGRPVHENIRAKLLNAPVTEHCNNGFGLYSSAKSIRAFGGDISFESDSGSTVFSIMLPASGISE